jgi:hypothetical protein
VPEIGQKCNLFEAFLAHLPRIMAQEQEKEIVAKKRSDKQKRAPHRVTPDYVAEAIR